MRIREAHSPHHRLTVANPHLRSTMPLSPQIGVAPDCSKRVLVFPLDEHARPEALQHLYIFQPEVRPWDQQNF